MKKYILGEIFSSGGATLYKNPSNQTVQGSESDEDSKSLSNKFVNIYPDNMVQWDTKKYDTYFDKTKDQAYETVYVADRAGVWSSVLLNR